jgi:hypothetical protein
MADQFHDNTPLITNQIAEDIPDIAESLGFIKDVFQNFCLGWSDTVSTGIYPKAIKRTALTSTDSPYTVLATDTILECNGAGGAIECDLQAAATAGAGRFHIVKATSVVGGNVTIDPNGTESLEGASSSYTLDQANEALLIYCTGAAWFVVSHYRPTLSVDNGGTGATTFTDGGLLLGSGTSAITALGAAANGQIPIGDGATDPVLATITGTADEIDVTNGAGSITIGLVNPLAVSKGGTGAATLDDGGLVVGNTTGAVEVVAPGATTTILVGGGAATKPTWDTVTGTGAPVKANTPTLVTPLLGTPTSGDLRNCDLSVPPAIGGTTPAAGAFTTISASGVITATGGQIQFPATAVPSADANTLDDYEEGTFTPAISGSTGNPTHTSITRAGFYVKIGSICYFRLQYRPGGISVAGSGNTSVTGLPFTSGLAYNPVPGSSNNLEWGSATQFAPVVLYSSTSINLRLLTDNSGTTVVQCENWGANEEIFIAGVYQVA